MACFIVPVTEAVITTAIEKNSKSDHALIQNLPMLNGMLWGGSALLVLEHIWHGEITPIVQAFSNADAMQTVLHEMATAGVGMSALVTAVWAGIVLVTERIKKSRSAALPVKTRR